ncbi:MULTISPECIES: protoporphyrinogen oxidase [Cryobacterium]|uniref:protoporphyrinogen oxidase n=1 Tax=Cryobacterium TaxID=69578 RepID=UPI000CD42916|nr:MULTISPECIES: protoporphyrinogen oxidase [Cryobacterium]POH67182.1 protoporphyrinogen oxidase [Cryobacterium zongtaii]TFC43911.1 protoporphyrinogen oxidase [Cryobacterium sp. TMN-39-2]
MKDVLVIGGGVAGLVAARECAHLGLSVVVLETADAPGGAVAGHEVAGLRLDAGAESFAVRGNTVAAFIADLGLTAEIIEPNPAGAWLHLPPHRPGGAPMSVPLPKAGVLGIPGSPLAEDVRRAIGWSGALRAYADRLMPVLKIGREQSLGELVGKRMGTKVLERLVNPVAGGVYATAAADLEVDVVAPGLNRALTTAGSLSGAVTALRTAAPAGSAVRGLNGGMHRLVAALVTDLDTYDVEIRTSTAATGLTPVDTEETGADGTVTTTRTWAVRLAPTADAAAAADAEPGTLEARQVILAVPAAAALALLAPLGAEFAALAALDWPEPAAVELATLVLDAPVLDAHPRGTGALVAEGTPGVTAKAITHVTAKWAWVDALTPPGRHIVRLSYGRAGAPVPTLGLSDDQLQQLAVQDAAAILGVDLAKSQVAGFARTLWADGLSPATIGAPERIRRVREVVETTPGLDVTGGWLSGTGLASVIPDALAAGIRVRRAVLDL